MTAVGERAVLIGRAGAAAIGGVSDLFLRIQLLDVGSTDDERTTRAQQACKRDLEWLHRPLPDDANARVAEVRDVDAATRAEQLRRVIELRQRRVRGDVDIIPVK